MVTEYGDLMILISEDGLRNPPSLTKDLNDAEQMSMLSSGKEEWFGKMPKIMGKLHELEVQNNALNEKLANMDHKLEILGEGFQALLSQQLK